MNRLGINVIITAGTGDEITERREVHNLIVDTGLGLARDLFHQKALVTPITHLAFGSGDTAADHADTTLDNEVYRAGFALDPADEDSVSLAKTTYTYYLGTVAGNLGVLYEMGLFTAATLGTMFARVVFAPILKDATTWIKVEWEITFADDGV